jgi:hypothetical protein
MSRIAQLLGAGFALFLAGPVLKAGEAAGRLSKELLVIAPRDFIPSVSRFVAYKATVLPTKLFPLELILKENAGIDDPEKLKRFLYNEWKNHNAGYVLLVGDVDIMPVRFMVLDRVTPAAFDYAFYPSDLYYSDLAKTDGSFEDWNAQKNSFHAGYFGEVRGEKNKQDPINYDGVDYLPDIAVGRWPVSTVEELKTVIDKTIAYEIAVRSGSKTNLAAFFAVGGWVDSRGLMGNLASRLANGWHVEKRFYSDGSKSGDLPPDHKQIRAVLNDGASLVVHAGHGAADAWAQCFSLRDLDAITNAGRLPVILSAGCSTAYFAPLPPYGAYMDVNGKEHEGTDNHEVFISPPPPPAPYQRGRFNPTGLGEQLLKRGPNGAVAYIGCNTGSQPCALTLVDGFVSALADAKGPRLGDCWASAIRYYFEHEHLATLKPNTDWYPPSIFFQGMKFMLFGDPSLRMPSNQNPS